VDCKVLNPYVILFARYKNEKLFERKKKSNVDLDAPMNNPDRECA
jgi:hypothetical protein